MVETTSDRLHKNGLKLQHKGELHAVTVGVLLTWNLLLTATLFALTNIHMVFALIIGILTLLLAIFTRKLVVKTPEELLEVEDKNERRYTNRKD